MKFTKIIAAILALVMVLGLAACGGSQAPAATEAPAAEAPAAEAPAATEAPAYEYQEVTLGWATTSSEGTIVVDAMHEFADRIAEATGGKVKVDLYPGSQLGSAVDTLEQVQMGALAMANTQPTHLANIGATEMTVLSMPYLFTSFDQRWEVIYGEIGQALLDVATEKAEGVVGFSYYGDGARHFFSTFPIETVADMAGHKVRVQDTKLDNAWCTALGASPTPTASSEMYQAMSSNLVEAAEQPIANYYASKFYEVSDYFVLDGHTYNTITVAFSEAIWNTLDVELQTLLKDTWNDIMAEKKQVIVDAEADFIAKIEAEGVKVSTPSDLDAWAACMDSVYAEFGVGIEDWIAKIQAVK